MNDPNTKRPRTFQCRDILWDALEQMAGELECSVDYLANEALKAYVRQRGGRLPVVMRLLDEPSAPARAPQAGAPPPMPPRGMPAPPGHTAVSPPGTSSVVPPAPLGPPTLQDGTTSRPGPIAGAPPLPPLAARGSTLPATPMPPRPSPGGPAVEGGLQGKPGASNQAPPLHPPPPPLRPPERSHPPHPLTGPPPLPGSAMGYGGSRYPAVTPPPAAPAARTPPPPGMQGMPPPIPPAAALPPLPPPPAAPSTSPSGVPIASGQVPSPPLFVLYAGERYEVAKDRFIIGRGRQAVDLTIKDPNISRHHAMIEFHGGQYFIVDMGSTNGIEHEGQRITRKPVVEGDLIRICDHEVRFTYH